MRVLRGGKRQKLVLTQEGTSRGFKKICTIAFVGVL